MLVESVRRIPGIPTRNRLMTAYSFEQLPSDLSWMPLSARRAADHAGRKPSLSAWQSLSFEDRQAIIQAGTEPELDTSSVNHWFARAHPEPPRIAPRFDPSPQSPPPELLLALGSDRPLTLSVWTGLSPLDRYALVKVAERRPAVLSAAYAEIVGQSAEVSHLDAEGSARMVGVSAKPATLRRAAAKSRVTMNQEAFDRLKRADAPKGDVLGAARLAGILGVKRTADWIPLCHPIAVTRVDVGLLLDSERRCVDVQVTVEAFDRTGVEMEALTGASAAALTVYDMLKAFDRAMSIGPTELDAKSGGRSGNFVRSPAQTIEPRRFAIKQAPISVDEVLTSVARPEAGGVVIFVGTVRDHNQEGPVQALEYQAYTEMAVQELSRVAEEIEQEIPGVRLAATHRSGTLRVGDAAVVCAASAGHRDEAFRAARALIDRLKERVPIWKREYGVTGPTWVGWQDGREPEPRE